MRGPRAWWLSMQHWGVSRRFNWETEPVRPSPPFQTIATRAKSHAAKRGPLMATYTDIARRVYNHTWKLDPIVRSLLDTDFYKLLMLQMIWGLYPKVNATFSLINRTKSVRLADEIDIEELRAQLDHARTLRFTKKEMIWLAGNSFYGSKQIFEPDFLKWLEDFLLPDYRLEKQEGQFVLEFPGLWLENPWWEIPALAII